MIAPIHVIKNWRFLFQFLVHVFPDVDTLDLLRNCRRSLRIAQHLQTDLLLSGAGLCRNTSLAYIARLICSMTTWEDEQGNSIDTLVLSLRINSLGI